MVSCELNSYWRQLYFLRHLDVNLVQKWQKCQIWLIYEIIEYYDRRKMVLDTNQSVICHTQALFTKFI